MVKKYITIFLPVLLLTCSPRQFEENHYDQYVDTLVLQTEKVPGFGRFIIIAGGSPVHFRDTTELKNLEYFKMYPDYPVIFIENLKNIKLDFKSLMMVPLRYYDSQECDTIFQKNNSIKDRQMLVVSGYIDGKEVFMIDQNHNQDFRDDSVRELQDMDWFSSNHLIKCQFDVEVGDDSIGDYGWYSIGIWRDDPIDMTAQHMISSFSIGDQTFKLGVFDENSSDFSMFKPTIALLGENGYDRDTLFERDILRKNEFVKLGSEYYRFHDYFSGSGTILLIKEKDFASKTGLQVGNIAPDFKFVAINGDTITSDDFIGKSLLIANMSWCSGDDHIDYKEIIHAELEDIQVIGLEWEIEEDIGGIIVDVTDPFNEGLYLQYRNAYSSYDAYLINAEGRIEDKFGIWDWKSHLN